ncbi:MAG: ABC transporter permease [Anaerolineae bacterium]
MNTQSTPVRIGLALLPIIVSLLITSLLIIAVGSDPRAVFEKVWEGALRDSRSFSGVVNFWIPFALAGIGLIVTFTAGLWNIGVEGQIMMGAVFATAVALNWKLPPLLLVPAELLAAMVGGALWASIVGVLKIRLGVHEIFGGVALNALANVVSIFLISGPWQPPEGGSARGTPQFTTDALLPSFSPDFEVSLLALFILAIIFVAVFFALRGTRWGLQLKATGKNARSALLLGVPTERTALSALIVCGMVAGIAGSYRILSPNGYGNLRPLVSGGIGFLALLVVLLVSMRVLWVPLVTMIFAAILSGSTRLKIAFGLDASLAGVLQETLVLVVLLFNGLRGRLERRRQTAIASENIQSITSNPSETVSVEAAAHE